jgi:hypothetical protein
VPKTLSNLQLLQLSSLHAPCLPFLALPIHDFMGH